MVAALTENLVVFWFEEATAGDGAGSVGDGDGGRVRVGDGVKEDV